MTSLVQLLWIFIVETWGVFLDASLFILFGFLIATAIHYWVSPARVYQLLGRNKVTAILLASVAGIPLPLCSCSVVPTAIGLRKHGASKGATVSFLIAAPETSAESIALTYGLMDLPMTLFRPIAALLTALLAGTATELFGDGRPKNQESLESENTDAQLDQASCECEPPENAVPKPLPRSFFGMFWELFDELSYWLLLGLVLSGLISALVPQSLIENYLGGGLLPMLVMLAVSVPLYICASGSTPIAAALILKGMSPGAALVFLLAGPATNVGTITILWKFLGKRILIIYLVTIAVIALAMGLYVDGFYQSRGIDPRITMGQPVEFIPDWLKIVAAWAFILLLWRSIRKAPVPREMKTALKWVLRAGQTVHLQPRRLAYLVALLFIASYLLTSVLIVQPGEVGIVKRFGKILRDDLPPGLHLHLPYPLETSECLPVDSIRILTIGFLQDPTPGGSVVNPPVDSRRLFPVENRTLLGPMRKSERESYFLTGDENLIDIQTVVQYRIADPVLYLYGVEEAERIVRNHTVATLVELIGRNRVDEVYTFLREQIESEGRQKLMTLLERQKTGIEFLDLYLVNVHAPPEVHDAFRDLASAREDKSRLIHDAQGRAAESIQSASGEASSLLHQAEEYHVEQVFSSEGGSAAYRMTLEEYEQSPLAMRKRLLYETWERVLPEAKLYLWASGPEGAQFGLWRWDARKSNQPESPGASGTGEARQPILEDLLGPR